MASFLLDLQIFARRFSQYYSFYLTIYLLYYYLLVSSFILLDFKYHNNRLPPPVRIFRLLPILLNSGDSADVVAVNLYCLPDYLGNLF